MLISMLWCYPPNEEVYEPFKAATLTEFWLEEFPNGPVFVSRKMDIQLFVIVGFIVKISQKLKSHTNSFKQSKILYKQLHWTLIAQAIGPIIVGNLPALCLITMMEIGYENNYISIMLSSTLGWVAVVNPLAAIIIMSPYKKRVKKMLKIGTQLSVINISSNNVKPFNLHSAT
uniref:Uncharacterized protein n=1 Tax=Panagrolaimus sp. PS1159 TaxID=55785 RepID=A0AC35FJG0_9BILA